MHGDGERLLKPGNLESDFMIFMDGPFVDFYGDPLSGSSFFHALCSAQRHCSAGLAWPDTCPSLLESSCQYKSITYKYI